MKINDTTRSSITPQASQTRLAKDVEKASLDKVASDTGSKQATTRAASTNPGATALTFDSKRVEALKLAIANGTFEINPEKIADGLIRSVQNNLSRK